MTVVECNMVKAIHCRRPSHTPEDDTRIKSRRAITDTIRPSTVKDKAQHAVILDKATSEKLNKDVQSYRLVTVATLVDRLKINGSLARQCLKDLEEKGQIKPIVTHSKMLIYSTFPISHLVALGRDTAKGYKMIKAQC